MSGGTGNHPASRNSRVYADFDGGRNGVRLGSLCLDLLAEQKETWPECRAGYESLDGVKVRDLSCSGFSVRIQHNPGRIRSTTAVVEEKAVSERPCFLCAANLPDGQKGVLYKDEYLILCNPMPVFRPHFTVSHCDHRPQAIEARIDVMLRLAADLDRHWAVLYNGPRCGASAPDHLHFQSVSSGRMPVEREIEEKERLRAVGGNDGARLFRVENIGREALLIEGENLPAIAHGFRDLTDAFKRVLGSALEPMMSVACFYHTGSWRLLIFPRAKHRPEAFFKEDEDRMVVSPAVIEMGGVIVTPRRRDFERLEASRVEDIYRQVSLDGRTVEKALSLLT